MILIEGREPTVCEDCGIARTEDSTVIYRSDRNEILCDECAEANTRGSYFACDGHDERGMCDEECLQLTWAMQGYDASVAYDPTGCSYPRPTPEWEPHLIAGSVMMVHVHPEDCQCSSTDCPTYEG